jgi:glycosyltransferase involved in cell wall biosynthesis
MKVLIVATWFPSPDSPVAGTFIAEQARALAARHQVTVLAPAVGAAASARTRAVGTDGPYPVIRVNVPARSLVHHLDYARAVAQEIKAGDFDIAHAHVTLPGGFAAVLAGMLTRRPVVITEHRSPFDAFMQTARDRFKVRFALTRAAAVIPTNYGLEARMRHYGIRRPLYIVRNNIDTRLFACSPKPPRTDDCFRLIFVGRLNDEQKNLPALLRALRLLKQRHGDRYLLKIIGGGELQAGYEQMARELGIFHLCEFAGAQNKAEIARSLAASDLFVLPSFHENCPSVVAEAQAVGRPAVVTVCGGSEELIAPHTGIAVPVNDHLALADAINRVCENLDSYHPEAISAYAVSRFGDEAVVSQLTQIYESVLTDGLKPQVLSLQSGA